MNSEGKKNRRRLFLARKVKTAPEDSKWIILDRNNFVLKGEECFESYRSGSSFH